MNSVHPRWRGEQRLQCWPSLAACGSSPLARGTGQRRGDVDHVGRFIPAGAGNSAKERTPLKSKSVHPRWRGEQHSARRKSALRGGSSPLARGTGPKGPGCVVGRRFIPAGAGNSSVMPVIRSNRPVHPRWRGEQSNARSSSAPITGSSPLARGTAEYQLEFDDVLRFIPAGAGNSAWRRRAMQENTVHPRWRGEQISRMILSWDWSGSSPLARGTGRLSSVYH